MGKYAISKTDEANPYLMIEPEDVQKVEEILNNLNILHVKTSSVKDGQSGKTYFEVKIIEPNRSKTLQKELDTIFP